MKCSFNVLPSGKRDMIIPRTYACRSDFWYGTFDADRLGTIESMYPLYRCSHCLNVRPQYLWSQMIGMWTVIVLLDSVVCVMTVWWLIVPLGVNTLTKGLS